MNFLILSAFPEEQAAYFRQLDILKKTNVGFVHVTICEANNAKLYFASTGMGTVNAALVLATLSASVPFDAIFFSGTSGAIDSRVKVGDVVVAEEAFDADIFSIHDAVLGTPFEAALTNPNNHKKTPRFFSADRNLLACVKLEKWRFSIFKGRVATSNHFPSPKALFESIKTNHALVIDMESAAVYQFAWLCKIPVLIVRGVSNTLDAQGDDKQVADARVDSSSENAALVLMDCIQTITTCSSAPVLSE